MSKPLLKKQARELRSEGESIKAIAKKLNISLSSASLWCRDIKLTQVQIDRLQKNSKDPHYGKRLENVQKQQSERLLKTLSLKKLGIKEVGKISSRELFLIGISLYWAEGFKKDTQAGFCNSEPRMIKLFIKWLKDCFGYKNTDLVFRLNINQSHRYREVEIKKYWSSALGINIDSFQKTYFQKVIWKKEYENKNDYMGVMRIKVRKSTDFLRKIHGFIEGLSLQA